MSAPSPSWISAEEVFSRVSYGEAIRAIQRELRAGLDPSADFARSFLDVEHGQLLLMPSESADYVGVKVATVARTIRGSARSASKPPTCSWIPQSSPRSRCWMALR